MMEKKRKNSTLPTQTRVLLHKYLSDGESRLVRGEHVEVIRSDRSKVIGGFVVTGPDGVILETAPDEITAIPLADVRAVRRPRPGLERPQPSWSCITDCSACGVITLCERNRIRGMV